MVILCSVILMSCSGEPGTRIVFGVDVCSTCGMVIDSEMEAAGLTAEAHFTPFCNPMCMIRYINQKKTSSNWAEQIWVSDYTGRGLISTNDAFFAVGSIPTVMNSGIVAFAEQTDATGFAEKRECTVLSHQELRQRFEKPDKTIEVIISAQSMSPEKITAQRNDVIYLKINHSLLQDDKLIIKGYEETISTLLHPDQQKTVLKFIPDKPGAGFPIVLESSDQIIGQLIVQGSHTAEENL